MRNSVKVLLISVFALTAVRAQVKIGDNPQTINPASVLELESNDKVLVITRVTTAQMNAIVPSQGALCYNTDLQNVQYYDGTKWVSIGERTETSGILKADAIVNTQPTIIITSTESGDNLEVAPNSIRTEQIVDGGVKGIDIQNGSIGRGKLQDFSITREKLSENSVGFDELDTESLGVSVFKNDAGYITAGDINIVSSDAGNAIENRANGAFYDDESLLIAIEQNTDAIALDNDTDDSNEIQSLRVEGNQLSISDGNTIPLPAGADDQTAEEVTYDPATSGLTATDTQAAIDELVRDFANEQSIALDIATNQVNLLDNDATVNSSIKLDGTTIEAFDNGIENVLQLADEAVTLEKINQNGATNGQVLKWNDAIAPGVGGWETGDAPTPIGTKNSIFYAGPDGKPITVEENGNDDDNRNLYWDTEGRPLGAQTFGALFVGLEGIKKQSISAKMQIADNFPSGIGYALQVQNYSGSPTGILFSTDRDNQRINYGKGSLIYQSLERRGEIAFGDFHFLQNNAGDTTLPGLADKAFSIKNNKDIVVYGGINVDGTRDGLTTGTGLGIAGQVLSSTGTGGLQWVNSATIPEGTAGALFFSDGAGALQYHPTKLFWDSTNDRLGIGTDNPSAALQVIGETRSTSFGAPKGTAGEPSYSFTTGSDSDTGMYRPAADELGFSTGGIEALRVDEYLSGKTQVLVDERLGVGFNLTPDRGYTGTAVNSTVQINGSLATDIKSVSGPVTLEIGDHTLIFDADGSVTLPNAAMCKGRIYIIKNPKYTVTSSNYNDSMGELKTIIPAGVIWLQSTGTSWEQIN